MSSSKTIEMTLSTGEDLLRVYKSIGDSCMSGTPWLLTMFVENPDRFAVASNETHRCLLYRDKGGEWAQIGGCYGPGEASFDCMSEKEIKELEESYDAFNNILQEMSRKGLASLNERFASYRPHALLPLNLDRFAVDVPSNRALPYMDRIAIATHITKKKMLVIPAIGALPYWSQRGDCSDGGVLGMHYGTPYSLPCEEHESDGFGFDCRVDPVSCRCSRGQEAAIHRTVKEDLWGYEANTPLDLPWTFLENGISDIYGYPTSCLHCFVAVEHDSEEEPDLIHAHLLSDETRSRLKATRRKYSSIAPIYTTKDKELIERIKHIKRQG